MSAVLATWPLARRPGSATLRTGGARCPSGPRAPHGPADRCAPRPSGGRRAGALLKRSGRERTRPKRGAAGPVRAAARLQEGALADQLALKDRALDVAAEGVTIADARLADRPLIYVNEGFERVTGYSVAETLGRNCRFLQGPGTDPAAVAEIRAAVAEQRECLVEILNYRRDGTPFWNRLSITPVRNERGEVTDYIGIQSDVTARREAENGLRRAKEALEHDLRLAVRVQQALLPPAELSLPGVRIARTFRPCADLAGDAVGVVAFAHGPVGLYLLDVSGHGVGAALLSFTLNRTLSPSAEGSLLIEDAGHGLTPLFPRRGWPSASTGSSPWTGRGSTSRSCTGYSTGCRGGSTTCWPVTRRPSSCPDRTARTASRPRAADRHDRERDVRRRDRDPPAGGSFLFFYTDGVAEALDASEQEFGSLRLMAEVDRARTAPCGRGSTTWRISSRTGRGPPAGRRVPPRHRAAGLTRKERLSLHAFELEGDHLGAVAVAGSRWRLRTRAWRWESRPEDVSASR